MDTEAGFDDIRSSATSDTWYTVKTYTNAGFAGTPGIPTAWGSAALADESVDISVYGMGVEFDLRFRFDSDGAYSSQDQYNNAANSVKDGAWQLDNIALKSNGTPIFYDDSESGQNGWVTDTLPAQGQTGVSFWRGQFGIDFITGRDFTCETRPVGTWMYAAVSAGSGAMIDDEFTWLVSPPIDVSGAPKLAGKWDLWLDMPPTSGDGNNLFLASNDMRECVTDHAGFLDEDPGWWYGGPFWGTWTDDWDAFAGNDWLAIAWEVKWRLEPTGDHMGGIFVNYTKVGIPSGDAGTQFDLDTWFRFNDWYVEQMADALADTGRLLVSDDDGIVEAFVVATNNGGTTWESYPCIREDPESDWWWTPPPVNQMTAGSEIHYYFSASDSLGNIATYPDDAPARVYEFSILPIEATPSNPGLLIVDKHGRRMPGEARDYAHTSEYYYGEMMDILGYDYEVYDVEVPSGTSDQSHGPDTMAFKYYDTQIWFFNEFDSYTMEPFDQNNLVNWLNEAGEGKERNLLVTGNGVGFELMDAGIETLGFYETWLASHWIDEGVGSVLIDSVPTLRDRAGGFDFMTHDDGECILTGGCPSLNFFDVVEPRAGISGNEAVADYVKQDASSRPAGVAYTHTTLGYQTVNLGFGMEFMMDSMQTSRTPGYFTTGIWDRQNLMANIMDYFGKTPDGPGTGVVDGGLKNELSHAYPNPFNPITKIAYSVKESGPVSIEVYNVAGRVVRTLLSGELDAGTSGYVVWDGRGDSGERCSSGVYFYRIAAPGFTTSRKMVMLK